MQPALLLPHEKTECSLRVWVAELSPAAGLVVRAGLCDEQRLTSVHYGQVVEDLTHSKDGRQRLAPDSPFLQPRELRQLDQDGIVRPGERVEENAVLISLFCVKDEQSSAAGMHVVVDETVRTPEGWEGATVQSVTRRTRKELGRGAPQSLLERIEINLRLEQPLAAGDLLQSGNSLLGIVGEFRADADMPRAGKEIADIILPKQIATQLGLSDGMHELSIGKSTELGAFHVFAVANGPHSLITNSPLGGGKREELGSRHPRQPASITTQHIGWLRDRGLDQIAAELVCTKCDDFVGHRALRKQIGAIDPRLVPAPGTSAVLQVLRFELMSFGLLPTFRSDSHISLTLNPATRDELLAQSTGKIQKPETINYRTYKPEPGGIMCPAVYGEESDLRNFGHFELGCEVVPYLWRDGHPSLLEQMLGIKSRKIEQLVQYKSYVRQVEGKLEWQEAGETLPEGDGWLIGAAAIKQLLSEIPAERLPAGLRGRATALVQDVILIPPVWIRPLVLLRDGNFATSDLNDHYRRVINRANRLRKLAEFQAPLVILLNERRLLQESVDALWANGWLPKKQMVMGSEKRPLKDLASVCLPSFLADTHKKVEWSGQARAVLDESLPPATVRLPRYIYETLRLTPADQVMLTRPLGPAFVAAAPEIGDGNVIRLSAFAAERLPENGDESRVCHVHRPLGVAARAEAAQLNEATATRTYEVDPLFSCLDEGEALVELAQAVALGREISFACPTGVLLAGLGPVEFPTDSIRADSLRQHTTQVPIPTTNK